MLSNHENAWKNTQCLLLTERINLKKATYCISPTIWYFGKGEL